MPIQARSWTALDLDGPWKVTRASDDLMRTGVGLETDDQQWPTIEVPSHWQSTSAFAEDNGPLLYRRHFDLPVEEFGTAGNERLFVVADGLFYQGDVWLDGAYLGDPEGYFVPHAYDVSALARLDSHHVLSIGLSCAPQSEQRVKRNITGSFQDSDYIDPHFNPGGIWRGVRLERTGPVRIDSLRVLCRDANDSIANIRLSARLDCDQERSIRIITKVDGSTVSELDRSAARGLNECNWDVDIDEPALWWPWSLGDQNLCDITVEIICNGVLSHSINRRTGLREVAVQDWIFSVNGERLFIKGANLAPTRADLGAATPAELRRDIELARDAGLDLVRLHGHISRPELYAAADELGMLIWQDFPLHGGYARQIRKQAVRQARAAVSLLGHHPSIITWCAHDDPVQDRRENTATSLGTGRSALAYAARHQLPSWNKSILDRWVKRAFEQADDTRPCVAHSGVLPHLPQLDGTDTHLFLGWQRGLAEDLPTLAARLPRLVRFVGEFGAQAIPESAAFVDQHNWPDMDWKLLKERYGLNKQLFDQRVPPAQFDSFDNWRTATQLYQAEVIKLHVETLRTLKYRPTGGFCAYTLNDAMPMISCSLLDHQRVPKLAYTALAEACRPVIVVAERLPVVVQLGQSHRLVVYVVSDLRDELTEATVTATVTIGDSSREWRWAGDIAADECTRVGQIDVVLPDEDGHDLESESSQSMITIDLTLECGDVVATNRYVSSISH